MNYISGIFFIMLVSFGSFQPVTHSLLQGKTDDFVYSVRSSDSPTGINADWNKEFWKNAGIIQLKNYMGEMPSHFPETQVKLKYDNDNIYVIFSVRDHYVRAVAKETNGRVYEDSCVEFFFTPGSDVSRGYFNLEVNCKGVFLLEYHKNNGKDQGFVEMKDAKLIEISHSLNRDVENEITEPVTWCIEYRIPISILSNYIPTDKPEPGIRWRANFYKCGDKTSHPHWLTWSPVNYPAPKFHLPEFFGWLEFK
jgi:hypothetical protein